jgi:hypothetical protein
MLFKIGRFELEVYNDGNWLYLKIPGVGAMNWNPGEFVYDSWSEVMKYERRWKAERARIEAEVGD